jgi:hypothetical protein
MSYKTYEVRVYTNGTKEWFLNGKLHHGCLCLDCFLKTLEDKRISIAASDITSLWLFSKTTEEENNVLLD